MVSGVVVRALQAVLLAGALAACGAHAQAWKPQKAVEIVVPTAAGGANDTMARLIQKVLQEHKLVPTPVLVINKPGGNQTLATVYVHQHQGDPHYLLYSTSQVFSAEITGLSQMHYTELTPIAMLMTEHTVVSVRADSPIRTLRDLMERLKADPQSISFGLVSRGGSNHVGLSQAAKSAGIDPKRLKTIVFKTNAESYLGLVGGHLQAVASSATAAQPFVQQGTVRILAIGAPQRQSGNLANVPTMREQGIDGRTVTNWRGIFAPRGITAAQLAYWDETFAKLVATDDWKKPVDDNESAHHHLRSREFVKFLETEYALSRSVLTELGYAKR
jgi:putative tricarboxylic transport membrane protein